MKKRERLPNVAIQRDMFDLFKAKTKEEKRSLQTLIDEALRAYANIKRWTKTNG